MFAFFFFNATATTEIYTLSLHDALPIFAAADPACAASVPAAAVVSAGSAAGCGRPQFSAETTAAADRKSTRLNSSHGSISYAVFCLKKKTTEQELARRAALT